MKSALSVIEPIKTVLTAALLIVTLSSGTAVAFDGPLRVKNLFPLFLTVIAPVLEQAAVSDSLSTTFSYGSIYTVRRSATWNVGLDMEVADLTIGARKDFGGGFEIGLDIPIISYNSGFMDGILNSYHDLFGFADYGRSQRPDNSFLFDVSRYGRQVLLGESGRIGIGDIRAQVKKTLLTGNPILSVRVDAELPTGSASKGYGNGSFDLAAALLMDVQWSDRVASYANLGIAFPGKLRAEQTIGLRQFVFGGAGVEWLLGDKFALLGQVIAQGSPYPKTGIGAIDRPSVLLSIGGRYRSGKDSFELSFSEDPNTAGAPDIMFTLNYTRKF